ncbi:hypothetical protein M3Y99_01717400 [Aphelenchoides fujianensis]|nr:hypothetical protein M3Y99_01717400 [Aphelenchoides fujianensis]
MSGHPPAQGHPQQLSTEQIHTCRRMTRRRSGKMMRDCTSEMTLTRGLPFAAFCVGSLYFARSRLPENLRFGPKRWPFYFLIGK